MSEPSSTSAFTFFNCFGQLVEIFREFTFWIDRDKLHRMLESRVAAWAAGAGLGEMDLLDFGVLEQ